MVSAIFNVWVGRDNALTTALLTALFEISFLYDSILFTCWYRKYCSGYLSEFLIYSMALYQSFQ